MNIFSQVSRRFSLAILAVASSILLVLVKVVVPGYNEWKPLFGQTTCVLDSNAYAAWKSCVQIEATATVTRDRRWPTTYTRYKSYDWKKKSNNGTIYPTFVEWVIKIG